MTEIITMVPTVYAGDMPDEVEQYCRDSGFSTHCGSEIYGIEDDGNPFSEWLKENGFIFTDDYMQVGIFGT